MGTVSLFYAPPGVRDIKFLLQEKKKKQFHKFLYIKAFILLLSCLSFFVSCQILFLCAVFTCLSRTPSSTLFVDILVPERELEAESYKPRHLKKKKKKKTHTPKKNKKKTVHLPNLIIADPNTSCSLFSSPLITH